MRTIPDSRWRRNARMQPAARLPTRRCGVACAPMPAPRGRQMADDVRQARTFGEQVFYLEEFRGRIVLVAVAPQAAGSRPDLAPLAAAIRDLVLNDTRVLLWWPDVGVPAERRLRGALRRAKGLWRRR